MVNTYADVGKNDDDYSKGKFTLREPSTRAVAVEVLNTHKVLEGASFADYLRIYFPRTWAHFDMNKVFKVVVEVIPNLLASSLLIRPLTFYEFNFWNM